MKRFKLISYDNQGKTLSTIRKQKQRVFSHLVRTIFSNFGVFSVYVKVPYGKHKDNFGKVSEFINEGTYENQEDLLLAYQAFIDL